MMPTAEDTTAEAAERVDLHMHQLPFLDKIMRNAVIIMSPKRLCL